MPADIACPRRQDWQQFLLGQTPEPYASVLEEHLRNCRTCVATLQTLRPEDPLVQAVRAQENAGDVPSSELVAQVIERLKKLDPDGATPRGGAGAWPPEQTRAVPTAPAGTPTRPF